MSVPPENLGDKFDRLSELLVAQHDELLNAITDHRNNVLQMGNRILLYLEGNNTGDNRLITALEQIASRTQMLVFGNGGTHEFLEWIRGDITLFNQQYSANNPLIVNALNEIIQQNTALFTPTNATNITVGEILVHLQECMDCGEQQFEQPADCGTKQLLIASGGMAGDMQRQSDNSVVVNNRLWVFDTPDHQLGMPYGSDTVFLSTADKSFYWPDHVTENTYISILGQHDAIVYYSNQDEALGNVTIASGTICYPVPESWQAFVISFNPGSTGFEAYIGTADKV